MKYKNATEGTLKFRANDKNGNKVIFELKPSEEMESDREVRLGGLELVEEKKKKKQSKEEQ